MHWGDKRLAAPTQRPHVHAVCGTITSPNAGKSERGNLDATPGVPKRHFWTLGRYGRILPLGSLGEVDRSRHDNRSDQWRKRTGARRRRAILLASVPKRLVFVTVAAAAVLVGQFVMQHRDDMPDVNLSNLVGPKPAPIAGVASVIDGDTIEVHGQRIRFNGIDAPESRQYCSDAKGFDYPCGHRSAEALDAFLAVSKPVQCTFVSWDRYHRFVGDCRRADGANVAAWMVEHGQALDWPRYSHGAYAEQQGKASAAKVGLWVGTFQAPWDWRAANADKVEVVSTPSTGFGLLGSGCSIKGNISVNSGEHIYHLPGQEHYDETVVTPSKGERWFCTEGEARAAGWRKARR
ncbi:thermonuclease family protein [Mesorhizobium sp. B2-5-4]|nr:thermonuclease family protein [Mesorhizobium sp. B2-5-13]TPK44838.1 thermonuclease family protein [Mesorhizobium sp. B2-5-4]TPK52238.1 thermonuclease family protein [Mesorhizobium sp. B2-5-5]